MQLPARAQGASDGVGARVAQLGQVVEVVVLVALALGGVLRVGSERGALDTRLSHVGGGDVALVAGRAELGGLGVGLAGSACSEKDFQLVLLHLGSEDLKRMLVVRLCGHDNGREHCDAALGDGRDAALYNRVSDIRPSRACDSAGRVRGGRVVRHQVALEVQHPNSDQRQRGAALCHPGRHRCAQLDGVCGPFRAVLGSVVAEDTAEGPSAALGLRGLRLYSVVVVGVELEGGHPVQTATGDGGRVPGD
mmetsp:Transcript_27137/g.62564  ORF Transcript_27137/g.62564 Transcript_27137/m.62564 type:complete len:250 (+) Transcript_27137:1914-2663(+)